MLAQAPHSQDNEAGSREEEIEDLPVACRVQSRIEGHLNEKRCIRVCCLAFILAAIGGVLGGVCGLGHCKGKAPEDSKQELPPKNETLFRSSQALMNFVKPLASVP
jgi:hypothetical protein